MAASAYRRAMLDAMATLESQFDFARFTRETSVLAAAMIPPELTARLQEPILALVHVAMADLQRPGAMDVRRGMVGPFRLLLARMQAQAGDVAGDPVRRARLAQAINNMQTAIARLEAANAATEYALATDAEVATRVQALQWDIAAVTREGGDWAAARDEAASPVQNAIRGLPQAIEDALHRAASAVPRAIGWGLKDLMPVLLIAAAAIALGGAAGKRTGEKIL